MTPALRIGTIAVLVLTLVAVACGGGTIVPSPSPNEPSPSAAPAARPIVAAPAPTVAPTPTPAPVYWPLSGIRADDPVKTKRRPLNVRLPNDPAARPHVGLSKADIVFEMIVEGGITRHSAIFHSQDAKSVGPVRSYRFSDLHITQMLRGALVASGATVEERDAVTNSIRAGNMISVDAERKGGPYYRVAGRPGPNNLFVDLTLARMAVNEQGGGDPVDVPPLRFFTSLEHDVTAGGFKASTEASKVTIPLRDPATYTYDEGSRGYRRSQAGTRTVDPDGNVPILARNVIVIHTDYWETSVIQDVFGSKGLDYRMTGGGKATVFRDGRRADGAWNREGVLDQFSFHDAGGEQILLNPGQTWVTFLLPTVVVTSEP
ncbi:MAG: DUF3048 domain-containing protein [Chloroflexi bacterium]|nr:DUF3048 domain-containing protein [Chloroflexota bacterium]